MDSFYYKVSIKAHSESLHALTGVAFDLGSLGVEDRDDGIIAYFDQRASPKYIERTLLGMKPNLKLAGLIDDIKITIDPVEAKDWNEEWKKRIQPLLIGERFIVLAPWHKYSGQRRPVIIEPGMAFGTGHHPTTQMCVYEIETVSEEMGRSFLDLGTGTGILSIVAANLGFSPIFAIDVDPVAIDIARRNMIMNKIVSVTLLERDIHEMDGKFSLISANLTSGIIQQMLDHILSLRDEGGIILFSGILEGQGENILEMLNRRGVTVTHAVQRGDWLGFRC
jgi:ribosomal protein L11 methyltransferase